MNMNTFMNSLMNIWYRIYQTNKQQSKQTGTNNKFTKVYEFDRSLYSRSFIL